MRSYIRHPCDIPIEFSEETARCPSRERLSNISQGGLAFRAARPQRRGRILRLRIPDVQPPFEAPARVSWCIPVGEGYEVGVEFIMPGDEFRARMVEQVCHIEHYKRRVRALEGRELTGEEAAREWIAKYAARFPDLDGEEG